MKVLIVLGVFVIFPTIHALSCISMDTNSYLEIPFHIFDTDVLKQQLNQLPLNESEDVCRVMAVVDHGNQAVVVQFSNLLQGSELPTDQVAFLTVIGLDTNRNIVHYHYLEYACSNYDGCEKQFVLDHIEWLFKLEYTNLSANVRPFLLATGNWSGKCHDS